MVGVGKTTATRKLGDYLGFHVLLESVGGDNPWLGLFYEDEASQARYGFHLQTHFLASRMRSLRRVRSYADHFISDTVADADAQIFARGLYEDGKMTDLEWQLYSALYEELLHSPAGSPPDVLIYLNAPLEEIERRIAARGRPSEQDVDRRYWEGLYGRYQRWVQQYDLSPVVEFDVREFDVRQDPYAVVRMVERLRQVVGPELDICRAEARAQREQYERGRLRQPKPIAPPGPAPS